MNLDDVRGETRQKYYRKDRVERISKNKRFLEIMREVIDKNGEEGTV